MKSSKLRIKISDGVISIIKLNHLLLKLKVYSASNNDHKNLIKYTKKHLVTHLPN